MECGGFGAAFRRVTNITMDSRARRKYSGNEISRRVRCRTFSSFLATMPNIHFECPNCAQSIDAPQELANQLVECPTCKSTIEVPARSRAAKPPGLPAAQSSPVLETSPITPQAKSYEYTVVPFVAVVPHGKGSEVAAAQLDLLIHSYSKSGWEYVRLENVETYIQGDSGCFGFGATPPRATAYSMAIFRR